MLQMRIIFLGLAFWNVVLFALKITAAWQHWSPTWIFSLGALTGIYTCLTHSVVMMHFMGSGKGVKEAVDTYALPDDPQSGYVRRTRRFKAQTSGHATLACLVILVAVWLGGWAQTSPGHAAALPWHRWFAYAAVLYNLYVFRVEHRVIRENTALIREIDSRIAAGEAGRAHGSMHRAD
jgi:hypothetical protein